jgi:hypothetical protein
MAIITKQSRGIYVSAGNAASSFGDKIKKALASLLIISGYTNRDIQVIYFFNPMPPLFSRTSMVCPLAVA